MTTDTQTIAQKIAAQFNDDGSCFENSDGQRLEDVCASHANPWDKEYEKTRFTFDDGSILTIAGDGWDFGFSCCYGWEGGGHQSGCENDHHPSGL